MRQLRRLSKITRAALARRSASTAMAATLALLLLFAPSLFIAPPHAAWAVQPGAAAAAGNDGGCAPQDGDRRRACLASALCCVADCDGSAPPVTSGRRQGVASTPRGPGAVAPRPLGARRRLALAGWASAWSSRAPPLGA